MDVTSIIAAIGTIVTIASALTNIVPTPASTAPSWQRIGYQALEWVAIVGIKTKDNPDAVKSALLAFDAAKDKNYVGAITAADATYRALTGDRPS